MGNIITSAELAKKIRISALEMTGKSGASHIGAILSVADIVAVLYAEVMQYDCKNPKWGKRDRFILSKGHAGAAVYAALAHVGFFETDLLDNYYTYGSDLSGHIYHKVKGIEVSTGSLGMGIGMAAGIAKALKINGNNARVFVVLGDGECNEGSVWEAVMFACQHKLDNLIIIIDKNKMQAMGNTQDIINMDNIAERFNVFGCNTKEVDGHNYQQIKAVLLEKTDKPKVVVANTIKGKGVSFMENNLLWHYRNPSGESLERALQEIKGTKQ